MRVGLSHILAVGTFVLSSTFIAAEEGDNKPKPAPAPAPAPAPTVVAPQTPNGTSAAPAPGVIQPGQRQPGRIAPGTPITPSTNKPPVTGGMAGMLIQHGDELGLTAEQKAKLEEMAKGPMSVLTEEQKQKWTKEVLPKMRSSMPNPGIRTGPGAGPVQPGIVTPPGTPARPTPVIPVQPGTQPATPPPPATPAPATPAPEQK